MVDIAGPHLPPGQDPDGLDALLQRTADDLTPGLQDELRRLGEPNPEQYRLYFDTTPVSPPAN